MAILAGSGSMKSKENSEVGFLSFMQNCRIKPIVFSDHVKFLFLKYKGKSLEGYLGIRNLFVKAQGFEEMVKMVTHSN